MNSWSYFSNTKYDLSIHDDIINGLIVIRYISSTNVRSYYDIWFQNSGFFKGLYFKPTWYTL